MKNKLIKIAKYLQASGLSREADQILALATMTQQMKDDLAHMRTNPGGTSGADRAERIEREMKERQEAREKQRAEERRNMELYGMSGRAHEKKLKEERLLSSESKAEEWLKEHFNVDSLSEISNFDLSSIKSDLEILTDRRKSDELYDDDRDAYEQLHDYTYSSLTMDWDNPDLKFKVLSEVKKLIRAR